MFNNETIIDRNIRKTLKKPINFWNIERQISYKSLHRIKSFTLNHIINWEFSQLWINYNPFQKVTSESYSKHVGWRIKCSNYALPTLDTLNRNYPDVLQGYDTCFLCSSAKETNEHFWSCTKSIEILISILKNHEQKFRSIIINHMDKDKINVNEINFAIPIFTALNSPIIAIHDIPELHCLLINLIPNCLLNPFKDAKIHKKLIKKLLLSFLFDLHHEIYDRLWKARNAKWKEHKKVNGINKKTFLKRPKQQRKKRRINSENQMINDRDIYNISNIGYNNPFMNSIRNLDNSIFWIYLTSSNFRHNLPWINSLSINFLDSINFDHNLFYYII
jgi:hypothetical protein